MADADIVKAGSNEISLDFGIGNGLSLDGLTDEQRREIAYKVQSSKADLAIDVASRKIKLESSIGDATNLVNTSRALDGTKADFSVKSQSETASGKLEISVHKNNHLALYILSALGILAVVALVVL